MKNFQINLIQTMGFMLLFLVISTSACKDGKATSNGTTGTETDISAPDMALQAAVVSGNFDAVQQHIKAGTDLNEKDALSGATPLITAITFGKDDIAKALIDSGVDLTIKNNDGSTALHVAAFFCRVEAVQLLLDAGADKTVKNNFGATPRETVLASFADMKPIYEMMQQQLAPIGLTLDIEEIEKTRPVVAMMLQ